MNVYASCSSYTLGQMTSPSEASALLTRAVADSEHEQLLPAVHALRELRYLARVELQVDGGTAQVAKNRSRHFFCALNSSAEAWLTIDDDVDTTRETLALLLSAVLRDDEPRICIAPCLLRERDIVNVEWSPLHYVTAIEATNAGLAARTVGGHVRRAVSGGFGLVAMNRAALVLVAGLVPSFRDGLDGVMKPAAFLEYLTADGRWLGEDVAFFERLQSQSVHVEGLVTGETVHAGARLDLATLKES